MTPPQPQMAPARLCVRFALVPVLVFGMLFALTAASASAAGFHSFSSSFGEPGSGNGQLALTEQSGLAVNLTSGDLYVADTGNARVEQFSSAGAFIRTFGSLANPTFIAVDNSAGASTEDVYVADSTANTVSKFTAAGVLVSSWGTAGHLNGSAAPGGAFGALLGLAVNPSGDLLVLSGEKRMTTFTEDGTFAEEFNLAYPARPRGFALDNSAGASAGDIYTRYAGGPETLKFNPAGGLLGEPDLGSGTGLAVDPSAGDLYVDHGTEILHYSPTGSHLESFGSPEPAGGSLSSAGGLAVGASNALYVANTAASKIALFASEPGIALTVTTTGAGLGEVTSNPTGIACGSTCEAAFAKGTTVSLTATPSPTSEFIAWSGAGCSGTAICEVTLSAAKSVQAEFAAIPQQALKVEKSGTGQGTVTGTAPPAFTPIECGPTCEAEYNQGTAVTLTASPATHSKFVAWSGCEAQPGPTECEVTLSAAKAVQAEFAAIPQADLTLAVTGSGEVTSSPAGIACTSGGGTCTEHFDTEGPESTVTLTATPDFANHFVQWSGPDAGICATAPSCEVTTSVAKSVQAEFAPTLHTLTVTPSGPGSLSAAAGAISGCEAGGGVCAGPYQEGSTVTLTASPAAHNHVVWTGCTATPSPNLCEVEIGASALAVQAAFSVNLHTLTATPTGPGSLSADSGAISACSRDGGICAGEYGEASTTILTASPVSHYHVAAWGPGDCKAEIGPANDQCEVEIGPADQAVAVAFAPNRHTLTLTPSGPGSVKADSGAIRRCSATGGTCSGSYIEAATLTLTATPAPHQAVSWSGCTHSSANTCEVTIGASDLALAATFAPIAHTLALAKAGTGQGQLTCDGGPCAPSYPEGTALALAATPAPGSTFAGWSGAGCSGTGACRLTLAADTSITATFDANPAPTEAEKKPPLKCRKGFVKKNGRCVHKPKPRHHRKKR